MEGQDKECCVIHFFLSQIQAAELSFLCRVGRLCHPCLKGPVWSVWIAPGHLPGGAFQHLCISAVERKTTFETHLFYG